MSGALLLVRIALGLLLAGHGTQKLFGWWGGQGPEGTGQFMHSLGHRPGRRMAIRAGLAETVGGLLIALGLFSPIGSAIVVGVMLVAVTAHTENGVWNERGGFELPMFYAVVAAALALTGPGPVSVDNAIGWHYGWIIGLVAIVIGVAGAVMRISDARDVLAHEASAAPAPQTEEQAETRRAA